MTDAGKRFAQLMSGPYGTFEEVHVASRVGPSGVWQVTIAFGELTVDLDEDMAMKVWGALGKTLAGIQDLRRQPG